MKILVLAYSRQAGGAEKSALKLQSSLIEDGHDAHFGTYIQSDRDFYPTNNDFPVFSFFPILNRLKGIFRKNIFFLAPFIFIDLLDMRARIKREKYDVVISFGAGVGVVAFIALYLSNTPQVLSERINPDPSVYKPSLLAQILRPWVFKHGVVCSVQTRGFSRWVNRNWGIQSIVTPNHFFLSANTYQLQGSHFPVIAVGRPAEQKGYDLLLKAWGHIESDYPNELWLVADDANGYLANLININHCKQVRLLPLTQNLNDLFNQSSFFVSTSRYEGYPNAIAEAIAFGIPVLTTENSDVIQDWSKLGICRIIPTLEISDIVESIRMMLTNNSMRQELSRMAVTKRSIFGWESARDSWTLAIIEAQLATGRTIQ